MHPITPSSAEDLAETLADAALSRRTIAVVGSGTKRLMAGPLLPADLILGTTGLRRILQYEPNDLTISVEAGHGFCELQELLSRHGQMIALDPPFYPKATVGGVVATNCSGPMRRYFGTARDMVIGMKFALLNGKVASVGGMVVKNVSGLDLGKLMIGSFGTLAVMTSVNFRLHPLPEETNTFVYSFHDLDEALAKRDAILAGPLRPMAVDLLSPPAAARLGWNNFVLAIRAGGSRGLLRRYERELSHSERLTGHDETTWWALLREFSADFLRRQPSGVVVRVGTTLSEMSQLLHLVSGPFIARAASGVSYLYLTSWQGVAPIWQAAQKTTWSTAVEFAPDENRQGKDLWLVRSSGKADNSFAMMKRIKQMFDPNNLLNRSRLYGRL